MFADFSVGMFTTYEPHYEIRTSDERFKTTHFQDFDLALELHYLTTLHRDANGSNE